jgi:hypothetical protein
MGFRGCIGEESPRRTGMLKALAAKDRNQSVKNPRMRSCTVGILWAPRNTREQEMVLCAAQTGYESNDSNPHSTLTRVHWGLVGNGPKQAGRRGMQLPLTPRWSG